jgi:hypothetical protein
MMMRMGLIDQQERSAVVAAANCQRDFARLVVAEVAEIGFVLLVCYSAAGKKTAVAAVGVAGQAG